MALFRHMFFLAFALCASAISQKEHMVDSVTEFAKHNKMKLLLAGGLVAVAAARAARRSVKKQAEDAGESRPRNDRARRNWDKLKRRVRKGEFRRRK